MGKPPRIGVLGGTFDPIHNAHLALARAAQTQCDLDSVLFVVAARPPHKTVRALSRPEDRFEMVRLAVARDSGFEASRLELERAGRSYMVDTLRSLLEHNPGAELFLIMGADSAEDLPHWRDPAKIRELARLVVAERPGIASPTLPLAAPDIRLKFPVRSLSSTEIRRRAAEGRSLRGLVPSEVEAYIAEKNLYHDEIASRAR